MRKITICEITGHVLRKPGDLWQILADIKANVPIGRLYIHDSLWVPTNVGLKHYVWLKFCQKSVQGHNTESCVTGRNFPHEKDRNVSFRLSSTYLSVLQLCMLYVSLTTNSAKVYCICQHNLSQHKSFNLNEVTINVTNNNSVRFWSVPVYTVFVCDIH
jgi:hypothetical protein